MNLLTEVFEGYVVASSGFEERYDAEKELRSKYPEVGRLFMSYQDGKWYIIVPKA